MKPAKMLIKVEGPQPNSFDTNPAIEVMFNPTQFTIGRKLNWTFPPTTANHTKPQHTYVEARTLDITFFFDVFEENGDLLSKIKAIEKLAELDQHLAQPPACQFHWGGQAPIFTGVLMTMRENFTLFLDTGAPARATLTCNFKERVNPPTHNSSDVAKTHVVRRGDRLSGIARQHYNDASLWRPIADANGIVDPLRPPVGRTLLIPALTTGTQAR